METIMKHSLRLSAAVAAVLAGSAAYALDADTTQAIQDAYFADLVADGDVDGTTNVVLVVAGASAARDHFRTDLTQNFCQAGTFTQFQTTPTTNQDFRAYSCTLLNAAPVPVDLRNRNMLVYYRSEGGSAWGPTSIIPNNMTNVGTFLPQNTIKALHIAGTTAPGTWPACGPTATATIVQCAATGYNLSNDTHATGNLWELRTELAVADTEPGMFVPPNYPSSSKFDPFSSATRTALAGLNNAAQAVFNQVFGILVSTTGPTAGVTNLTTPQVTGLLSGAILDWSQIGAPAGEVVVCRREPGSGTQVVEAVKFLRQGCGPGYGFVTDADPTGGPDTDFVVENGTSTSAATCVAGNGANGGVVGTNPGAVGIAVFASAPAGTRFVTIDGVAPSVANAGTGAYKIVNELTMTKRAGLTSVAGSINIQGSRLADALITRSQQAAGVPDTVATLAIPGIQGNVGNGGTTGNPVADSTSTKNTCLPYAGS
jgi:hypothetical protein